jgi:hypothetical protein
MSDAAPATDPVFTTFARCEGRPANTAVRKAVAIARDAILKRMAHSTSKGSRYVAGNSYDDKSQFLSCSLVNARANYGWVDYACDRDRFEIRVFAGQQRFKQPLVKVKERHPLGSTPPRLDRDEIVAVLDRWLAILGESPDSPHEGWSLAARYVAALAKENGAVCDLPEPHVLILPSAYAPGRIEVARKSRGRPNASLGLDLDLFPDGDIATTTARLCHASTVTARCIDYMGDTRIVCDLSGEVSLKMTIPDPMSALRAMADADARLRGTAPLALAA